MDQTAAISALAKRFDLHESIASSSTRTPMTQEPLPHLQCTADDSKSFPYLSAIGSLLHIGLLTRPDISYAFGVCARHGAAYGPEHVCAVKKVIKCLFFTQNHGIKYQHKPTLVNSAFRLPNSSQRQV